MKKEYRNAFWSIICHLVSYCVFVPIQTRYQHVSHVSYQECQHKPQNCLDEDEWWPQDTQAFFWDMWAWGDESHLILQSGTPGCENIGCISKALRARFRDLDTAHVYKDSIEPHDPAAIAIATALAKSTLKQEQISITTKGECWNVQQMQLVSWHRSVGHPDHPRHNEPERGLRQSLEQVGDHFQTLTCTCWFLYRWGLSMLTCVMWWLGFMVSTDATKVWYTIQM